MAQSPVVPYWHLWTDVDGVSRLTRCAMTKFALKSMQAPPPPQWQGEKTKRINVGNGHGAADRLDREWHENPKPSDRPAVGPMVRRGDGWRAGRNGRGRIVIRRRSELPGPGRPARPSVGHGRRGARVLMVFQFDDAPAPPSPCEFA